MFYICSMISFLNSPIPLYELNKSRVAIILGSGLFVGLFLIIFQPFGTASFQHPYKNAILMGYSLVVILSFLLMELLFKLVFRPYFKEENWVFWKQLLFNLILLAISIAACYVYRQSIFSQTLQWRGLIGFYRFAMPIASFVVAGWVLLDYIAKLKRHQQTADSLSINHSVPASRETEEKKAETEITIESQNGKENYTFNEEELFYIQSADNYCQISTTSGSQLLRNTLNSLDTQVESEHIVRCHRSYIVNLNLVEKVSGNAQGYKLHLKGLEQAIPVARSKSKDILARLEA